MPTFQTTEELIKLLGGFLQELALDPELGPKLSSAHVKVLITYTDPAARILLDCTSHPTTIEFDPAGDEADFKLEMAADDGHRFWQGKFNVALALARKKVKVDGNLGNMMKLLPAMQGAYPKYPEFLKVNGYEHLLG